MSYGRDIHIDLPDGTAVDHYVGNRKVSHVVIGARTAKSRADFHLAQAQNSRDLAAADRSTAALVRMGVYPFTESVHIQTHDDWCRNSARALSLRTDVSGLEGQALWTAVADQYDDRARRMDDCVTHHENMAADHMASLDGFSWHVISTHSNLESATRASRSKKVRDRNWDSVRIIEFVETIA